MNSNTKWIWKNGETDENTWLNFIKEFHLRTVPQTAAVKIAVDSKYWLYVNGELAVFEGGIKRGPTKTVHIMTRLIFQNILKKAKTK